MQYEVRRDSRDAGDSQKIRDDFTTRSYLDTGRDTTAVRSQSVRQPGACKIVSRGNHPLALIDSICSERKRKPSNLEPQEIFLDLDRVGHTDYVMGFPRKR